jgi:hypothetical protein
VRRDPPAAEEVGIDIEYLASRHEADLMPGAGGIDLKPAGLVAAVRGSALPHAWNQVVRAELLQPIVEDFASAAAADGHVERALAERRANLASLPPKTKP